MGQVICIYNIVAKSKNQQTTHILKTPPVINCHSLCKRCVKTK